MATFQLNINFLLTSIPLMVCIPISNYAHSGSTCTRMQRAYVYAAYSEAQGVRYSDNYLKNTTFLHSENVYLRKFDS